MNHNDNRDIYMITPLVFILVVSCTHLVKKMLSPAKSKTQIARQTQPQKIRSNTVQKPKTKIAQVRPQQVRPAPQARSIASIPAPVPMQAPTQIPAQAVLSVEDANITAEEQALIAEKESREFNDNKETEFLRQALGLRDIEIQAVYQQQKNHAQEISVYNRQINSGMVGSQFLKEEAIKLHNQWMVEHLGAENYRQLLSLVQ
ncbi:hypothetical protein [Bdellovibrio sp. HCB337]|uniref:hypothetical protein n=1 Tax=Bdellovibrio sp. HCB337 TaxID=3394358 RepID=UPI0039A53471